MDRTKKETRYRGEQASITGVACDRPGFPGPNDRTDLRPSAYGRNYSNNFSVRKTSARTAEPPPVCYLHPL
jgi:hypothetical protein